jgi:ribosomal protein L12E/L44/L45/RPP1/RPP2
MTVPIDRRALALDYLAACTGHEVDALLTEAGHTPAAPAAPPANPATAGDYPAHWLTTGTAAGYPPDTHSRRMSTDPRKDR